MTDTRVYIAGPLHGSGTELDNVRKALYWADRVYDDGMIPFIPHLYSFWNMLSPKPGPEWLRLDFIWLDLCDALLVIPGESPGTRAEVERFRGKPTFQTSEYEALKRLHDNRQGPPKRRKGIPWAEIKTPTPGTYTLVGGTMLPSPRNSPPLGNCGDCGQTGHSECKAGEGIFGRLPKPEDMHGAADEFGGSDFPEDAFIRGRD